MQDDTTTPGIGDMADTSHRAMRTVDEQVTFSVTLRDGATEEVRGADAYAQEQSMTTFFRTDGRRTVDCWAVRMASFRTEQILAVRRHEPSERPERQLC